MGFSDEIRASPRAVSVPTETGSRIEVSWTPETDVAPCEFLVCRTVDGVCVDILLHDIGGFPLGTSYVRPDDTIVVRFMAGLSVYTLALTTSQLGHVCKAVRAFFNLAIESKSK